MHANGHTAWWMPWALSATLVLCAVSLAQQSGRASAQSSQKPAVQKEGKDSPPPKGLDVKGTLTNKDKRDKVRRTSYCKVHELVMEPNCRYIIDLEARFDAYLRLETSAGQQLAADDDGGNGLNSRIIFSPTKKDTYRIIATSLGGNITGPYTLKVVPAVLGPAILQKKGALDAQDFFDVVRRNSYHERYTLKLKKGHGYTIEVQSQNFIPYLRVEDFRGNQISVGRTLGRRSELIFQPQETEDYRIIVTSTGTRQTGNYTLVIR